MHPEFLSLLLFMLATSCSPGPNNIVASYSGFNFGIVKTFPHMLGVIFGFTIMVCVLNFGLVNIFKIYPLIQEILKVAGSVFLIYLAYKISFSKSIKKKQKGSKKLKKKKITKSKNINPVKKNISKAETKVENLRIPKTNELKPERKVL